jgi:hypothetical protein
MKTHYLDTLQMKIDFIVADTPQKLTDRAPMFSCNHNFTRFIEDSDWDEHLLIKYGKGMDLLCWGIVIISALFFCHVGLTSVM